MIYCPHDTAWRESQRQYYNQLLARIDKGRRVNVLRSILRGVGILLVLGAWAFVLAYAMVGDL